jgi:hypothetical protein
MSLTYAGGNSDRATCVPVSLNANVAAFTILGWINASALANNRYIFSVGDVSVGHLFLRVSDTSGNLRLGQSGTSALTYITNDTPITTSTWIFVAAAGAYGVAGHIYTGTLTTNAAERGYGTSLAGSGTPTSNTTQLAVGQAANSTTLSFAGKIGGGWLHVYDRQMALAEIQSCQFDGNPRSSCKGAWRPGDNGGATVTDESGTGNHLTITGATVSTNFGPRFRPWFDRT